MASIIFENVTKRYDNGQTALAGLDLQVDDGQFLVLVGPSGCGKSTALRIAAGLDFPSAGRLLIDGVDATAQAPRDRDVAMVFQSYALYPHLTVAKNIGFGLTVRGVPARDIATKVRDVAATLELTEYLARKPAQLSGGQRQRVAMARALVRSPNAFLMDEPLSNLDARLRGQMREEIAALQRRLGVTTIYVTHDQVEAMTMGSRVAVMSGGVLQQVGPPRDLYDRPRNRFVAGFVGSPPMNFFAAEMITRSDGEAVLQAGPHRIPIRHEPGSPSRPDPIFVAGPVVAGVRPEAFRIASDSDKAALPAIVRFVEDLGATVLASVDIAGVLPVAAAGVGDDEFAASRRHVKVMLDGRQRIAIGEPIRLGVDAGAVHVFDPETGRALRT